MSVVQKRNVRLGFAVQSAFGTPAAAPTHVVGVTSGKVYGVELEEADLDTTWNNRIQAGVDRISAVPTIDTEIIGMPNSIGTLLYGVLGAVATTGTGPYIHTFTMASALPYLTVWSHFGDTDSAMTQDVKIDELEISFEKSGATKVKLKMLGASIDFSVAFPTPGVGVPEVVSQGVLKGFGGTFEVDGSTARAISGSIKIANGVETVIPAYSITPVDTAEKNLQVEINLTVVPEDLTFYRKVITGTTSGSTVSASPLYGTVELEFHGTDTNDSILNLSAPTVNWTAEVPDADAAGGPTELSIVGKVLEPGSGSPFTAVLTNAFVDYTP